MFQNQISNNYTILVESHIKLKIVPGWNKHFYNEERNKLQKYHHI